MLLIFTVLVALLAAYHPSRLHGVLIYVTAKGGYRLEPTIPKHFVWRAAVCRPAVPPGCLPARDVDVLESPFNCAVVEGAGPI